MLFILIWEGLGLLLVAGAGAVGIAAMAAGDSMGIPANATFIMALLVCASALYFPGRALNDPRRARTLVDVQTGKAVSLRKRHSFFYVPVQYLAVLPALMAVLTTLDVLFDL